MDFLRRIFGGGDREPPVPVTGGQLQDEEFERIGTEEDPLAGYEAALERNFEAMESERTDIERSIRLYEQSVAEGFVGSHPYERLARIYEERRQYGEALRVCERYLQLARSGGMPRGAQRSAERKLPEFEERVRRNRSLLEG
jgi:hypothetical protein